jgi:aryl-alcohol dehydrogenase-like predicted oxidoreductase
MHTYHLGCSDLKVTPITFGAWAIGGFMWGGADKQEAIRAIHKSIDCGITTIDTAPVYGFGKSEEIIGEAISHRGKREQLQILTKCGLRWDLEKGSFFFEMEDENGANHKIFKYCGPESIREECENSLKRLQTDYIDLYQVHWPDETVPIGETMEMLNQLKKEGKIREAGVSNYSVPQLKEARMVCSVVSNQVPYSMINRGIEAELVPYCRENHVGILAYSPMQRGLLTGKISEEHTFKKGDHRAKNLFFTRENIKNINAFLRRLKPFAESYEATLAQLVINWTIQQKGISSVLVGARNPDQVEDNAGAARFSLTDQEILLINKELARLKLEL